MTSSVSNKRIAKNTMFLYIRMIAVLLVSLYTTRIVFNALGVVDYGINNVVAGFVSMFTFLNTSMINAVQRYYNYVIGNPEKHSVTEVYNTSIVIQAILAVIILIALETVGSWYIYNKMSIPSERFDAALFIFHLSVISIMFVIMQIPYSSAIVSFEHMNFYAYVALFEVISKLVVAFVLSNVDCDRLYVYGFLQFLVTIVVFLLYYFYSTHHFKDLKFKFKFSKSLFYDMLSFSGWNVFGTIAYMLKDQGVNMILNLFFGPVVNAARGISNTIYSGISGFQSNIIVAFKPQLVQSYAENNKERVKSLFYASSKISFLMLSIISIPIIFEINFILNLWLGDKVPEYTNLFTILILINQIIFSLNTPLTQIVHASGQLKIYQIVSSIIIFLILPFSWLVLYLGYSPVSVYVVSILIAVINQFLSCIIVNRIFNYDIKLYLFSVIFPCMLFILLAIIVPLIIINILKPSIFRLFISLSIGLVYSCAVAYFIILNKNEQDYIKSIIFKLKKRIKR